MKKVILKFAAAALLVGGLAFNFDLNEEPLNNSITNLISIRNASIANAESDSKCNYIKKTFLGGCKCKGTGTITCTC